MAYRTVRTRLPVDLRLTLRPLRFAGKADPCARLEPGGAWRSFRTPDGPATLHLWSEAPRRIRAEAWGPGRAVALDEVPALVGADDRGGDLGRRHRVVADLDRQLSGLRLGRTGHMLDALVPTILSQKVLGVEAAAAYLAIVRAAGDAAPGPGGLLLPPSPEWLASIPSWTFHRWGVEHKRALAVRTAATYAHRLEEAAALPLVEARRRLGALPGVGPWSVNEVAMVALGDPDAVSVGDYWLPHLVTYALAGEPRGDDQRMLELLEPWRGQRGRVCRLLEAGGPRPPRFGPRLSRRNIAVH